MTASYVIITPVPEVIETVIRNSILRQAADKKIVEYHVLNLRDYASGSYRQVDDAPFGGGSGMVMMPEPLFKAIEHGFELLGGPEDTEVIYPSPQGASWNHDEAHATSQNKKLILICGHYKGIDQRVIDRYVTREYSLGDYITTSGELPALIILDSIVRLIPGVLNTYESALTDSFADELLDHPHYTRPRTLAGLSVPEILLSGHHKQVEKWRQLQREIITRRKRPDIWEKFLKKTDSGELENEQTRSSDKESVKKRRP